MYHLQCVNQSYWGVLSNLANQSYLVCLDREPLRHLYFNGSNIACWTGSKLFLLLFFFISFLNLLFPVFILNIYGKTGNCSDELAQKLPAWQVMWAIGSIEIRRILKKAFIYWKRNESYASLNKRKMCFVLTNSDHQQRRRSIASLYMRIICTSSSHRKNAKRRWS